MGGQTDTDADALLEAAALREQAIATLSVVEDQVAKRQEAILKRLVQSYFSASLTADEARAGIAGIAELRKLVSDLRRVAGEE